LYSISLFLPFTPVMCTAYLAHRCHGNVLFSLR
jgi:hypothetical protein